MSRINSTFKTQGYEKTLIQKNFLRKLQTGNSECENLRNAEILPEGQFVQFINEKSNL